MPNRIIKESICTSENLNQLSSNAENLFYRLIVKADDFGCYYGNVKIVKNTCFPLKSDDIKDKQITDWLNELVKAGLIFLYIADGGSRYIKLTKWEKHQQRRANKPKFPLPKSSDINCNQLQSNVPVFVNVFENDNRESGIENEYIPCLHKEVIEYLNQKAGTNYRHTTKKNQELIRARLNEKFTFDDFKTVIDKKVGEWKGTEMEKFLRPETLFGTKFEGYLNQKISKGNKSNNIFMEEDV
jgi:uncharacterized phage protein (TIGR02220 family)